MCVTKRRSSWACIGNPNPEQETSKGTHAQETAAYQRRPTTQHAAQGSNPPIGPLHMQLAKIPHTHHTTPPATRAASARYAWADIIQELLTRTIHRSCPGASSSVVRWDGTCCARGGRRAGLLLLHWWHAVWFDVCVVSSLAAV